MLRRPVDSFAGPDDPAAFLVADDFTQDGLLDVIGLVNGTTYFYRIFYRGRDDAWLPKVHSASATPQATYQGDGTDPTGFIRQRVEAGIAVEVRRKALHPSPQGNGKIEVLSAPFALGEKTQFPCVSVHHDSNAPDIRAIGNVLAPDERLRGGGWREHRGWLSRMHIGIVGVTTNPIERHSLHQALDRIVKANLPIFYAQGMDLIDFSQQQREDTASYNVPLYFTVGTFSCIAPSWISENFGEIRGLDVAAYPYGEQQGEADGD